MTDTNTLLLKANLKQLRLPTMLAEFEKLAREAAAANESYEQYLLRLTELEVAARVGQRRCRPASSRPASRCSRTSTPSTSRRMPSLTKQKVLELARGEWIEQHCNCLPDRQPGHGQDAPGHRPGPGRLPAGQARALLHRGGAGERSWRRRRSSTTSTACWRSSTGSTC